VKNEDLTLRSKKMAKLPEDPDSGFCDMNGRGVEVGCKNDQMPVTNLFDRTNFLCFQENIEFIKSGG
jgi:hypothetical protein